MRILWVCPFFPYPLSTGIQIRENNLIRILSAENEILLFSLVQSDDELKYQDALQAYCQKTWAVLPENKRPNSLDGKRKMQDVFLGLFDADPKYVYGSPSPNVVKKLEKVLLEESYDVLIADALYVTNYLWKFLNQLNVPKVLVEHNVESLIQKQRITMADDGFQKLRKWVYYRNFQRFEKAVRNRFDHFVAVSDEDRKELSRLWNLDANSRIELIPNGVDVSYYAAVQSQPEPGRIVFNGALTYDANFDAMQFFLRKVFPLIQKEYPSAWLYITGSTKGVPLDDLPRNDNVVFTGYLDDIRQMIKESWLCVTPLVWGGGTRLKILEAMAAGTPVVSTSKGAEGLELTPGYDIFIEDDPHLFADAVVKILKDQDLRAKLAVNAYNTVTEKYDWQPIGYRLQEFLNNLLDNRV